MLRAVALAARAFGRDDYGELALRNGMLLRERLVGRDGRVARVLKGDRTHVRGVLEDHDAVGLGFVALYELTFDRRWLDDARRIAAATVEWFWDDGAGVFHDTASDAERLVTRPRDPTDNAQPSGSSLAVELLLRVGDVTGDDSLRRRADRVLGAYADLMARHGQAFGHMLEAAAMSLGGMVELAIVGDPSSPDFGALKDAASSAYVPGLVLAGGRADPAADDPIALLAGRPEIDGRATAYVCRGHVCDRPVTLPDDLRTQLEEAPRAR